MDYVGDPIWVRLPWCSEPLKAWLPGCEAMAERTLGSPPRSLRAVRNGLYMYVCMYVSICIYTHLSLYICHRILYVFLHISGYTHMYVYIHLCIICIYVLHLYIYMHAQAITGRFGVYELSNVHARNVGR